MKWIAVAFFTASIQAQPAISLAPPVGNANGTAIAAIGHTIMLAWSDPDGVNWQRFDDSGSPIDATSHKIVLTPTPTQEPSVAIAASNAIFLVVWDEPCGGICSSVRAVRVPLRGDQLDSASVAITDRGWMPTAASDGFNFLVAFSRLEPPGDVFSRENIFDDTFDDKLRSFGEFNVSSQGSGGQAAYPKAIWTGSRYLLVWDWGFIGSAGVDGRFVATNGAPLGSSSFQVRSVSHLSNYPRLFSVASKGTAHLAFFEGGTPAVPNADPTECASIADDGGINSVTEIPGGYDYAVFDGREFIAATAPAVAQTWPFIAVADRGSIHIVSTVRRRAAASH